ncbi:MAG: hypothetical protein ACP5UZ_07595 [Thermoplasmata archaeon]
MNIGIDTKLLKKHASEFCDPVAILIMGEPDEMDLESFLANLALLEKLLKMKREK